MSASKPHSKREPLAVPIAPPIAGVPYTEAETALFLRLRNPRTLATWRCTGRAPGLKYRRVGNKIVYLGEDITEFLNAKPTRAKAPAYVPKNPRKKSPAKPLLAASSRKQFSGAR
jgi:hypothetical protein